MQLKYFLFISQWFLPTLGSDKINAMRSFQQMVVWNRQKRSTNENNSNWKCSHYAFTFYMSRSYCEFNLIKLTLRVYNVYYRTTKITFNSKWRHYTSTNENHTLAHSLDEKAHETMIASVLNFEVIQTHDPWILTRFSYSLH